MKVKIPTGYLFTGEYSKGQLETLSIGDYGKQHNVKADFLGYTRGINGVPNAECMPLSEKWVITLSTQFGCSMNCTFCDVPSVKFNGNATFDDLRSQVVEALECFPDVRYTERLNIHFARMGEPVYNRDVLEFSEWLGCLGKQWLQSYFGLRVEVIHPVLTTSAPSHCHDFRDYILRWCGIKNHVFRGQAGLQLSINSTNDEQRRQMFRGKSLPLEELSSIMESMPPPLGRKYCLNFALASGYEVDAEKLCSLFSPHHFMVKITPIHNNTSCRAHGIETRGGYESWTPYAEAEQSLKEHGFDVLVFVPSMDEEDGLVTCGNLALGIGEVPCKCSVL